MLRWGHMSNANHSAAMTAKSPTPTKAEIPIWLWLVLPPVVPIVQIVAGYGFPEIYQRAIGGEYGLVENATWLILLPAIVLGGLIVRDRTALPAGWLRGWLLLVTLGCVYFAGEEISWGQHFFRWATPEGLARLNDQGETNLHNLTSWLDQKPRLAVELFTIVGGVLVPLWARGRYQRRDWQYWFWPTGIAVPTALLAGVIKLPDRLAKLLDAAPPLPAAISTSETQEYLIALFLLLYLASIHRRLRPMRAGGAASQ